MKRMLLILGCVLMLISCTTPHGTTVQSSGERQLTDTALGGLAGVTIAAVAKANTIAMLVLGGVGASAGYYYSLPKTHVDNLYSVGGQMFRQGDLVTIVVPSDALFVPSSADMMLQAKPVLDDVIKVASLFPHDSVVVSANTDNIGDARDLKALSNKQAMHVAAYLWNHGLAESRVRYQGVGDKYPIADPNHANSFAVNRRIQVTLFPGVTLATNGHHYFKNMDIGRARGLSSRVVRST